ncbi:mitochondrial carrier [Gautieria morchelliformis]|nr:mitochondrial carrier [Gautieria morchelliformis]
MENNARKDIRVVGMFAGMGSGNALFIPRFISMFDTIKTRLQCSPPGTYTGALDCLKQTVKNESILALYKGATPPAVGWAAIDSVLLGSLHNYRLYLLSLPPLTEVSGFENRRLSVLGHSVAGLFAGWTSAVVAHPVELLKVNLQLQRQRATTDRKFKGPIDCARQVIKANGVRAFRSSFFFMFVLMRTFDRLHGTPYQMSPGVSNFLSGGLASFVFWITAIPSDNIKNRIMASDLKARGVSLISVAQNIYRVDGLRGYFAGLAPCLLRAFPVNASALFVYEGILRLLNAEKVYSAMKYHIGVLITEVMQCACFSYRQ